MSTNPDHVEQMERTARAKVKPTVPSYKQVDAKIRALNVKEMEQENGLMQASFGDRLQRVLKIYAGIKPLLTMITAVPILPSTWRAAVALFTQALEAVAVSAPDFGDFKAGKDL